MKEAKVTIKLGGQDHRLVFDNYAMMMLDEYLGRPAAVALQDMAAAKAITVKFVAAAVLAGLQHNEQVADGMDMRKACKLLPKQGYVHLAEFFSPILEALTKSLGFDAYAAQVPEEDRSEHPTVSPSTPAGPSDGESISSSPAPQDASQASSGA